MDPVTVFPTYKPKEVCYNTSILVDSEGVWGYEKLYEYTQPTLHFQIIIILAAQQALHFVLGYVGLPTVVSQITVGVAFGVMFKRTDGENNTTGIFSNQSQEILSTLALFGFILFLFLTGVKMDPKTVLRRAGRKAFVLGFSSVILPILTSIITTSYLLQKWYPPTNNSYLLGSAHALSRVYAVSTFPVIVALLSEMEILTSELGRLAISSAIVADASVSVLLLGILIVRHVRTHTVAGFLFLLVILIGVVFLARPLLIWIIKQTPEGRQVKDVYVVTIVIGVLVLTSWMQRFQVLGLVTPFLIGLMIPVGPPLGSALVQKLDSLVSGLLMPILVTICAMRINLHQGILQNKTELINVVVAIIVTPVKLAACTVAASLMKIPFRDSFSLALIMSSKGSIDVIFLAFLKDTHEVTEDSFTLMVMVTLANSMAVPLLVKLLFDSSRHYTAYVRRNIEMLGNQDELRMLVCIPRNEKIPTFLNFLNAGPPTVDSPMSLTVIHLVELLGRTTPIFISHLHAHQRKQDETDNTAAASSQVVVEAFRNFKQKYPDEAMCLDMYTTVTTAKLMQGDICNLALDKFASLILLPFHVHWAEDGTLDGEDFKMRNLNKVVMERAPCSVGILVNRGNLSSAANIAMSTSSFSASYFNIAVLYFGGGDDREATLLALRMMYGSGSTTLTVIHFKGEAEDEDDENGDCDALDIELLKRVRVDEIRINRRLRYLQEVVKDGPQTALILRSIVNKFDLMLVGRREGTKSALTSGLSEWSEFPEMGVIGDLLAVADLETRTSILVLQQQRVAKTVL